MPTYDGESVASKIARRKKAEQQVLEKFPGIVVGSSGWHRALDNRLKRVRL